MLNVLLMVKVENEAAKKTVLSMELVPVDLLTLA